MAEVDREQRDIAEEPGALSHRETQPTLKPSVESPLSDSKMDATDGGQWNPFYSSPQNGDSSSLSKDNPFYAHDEESAARSPADPGEAGLAGAIFAPPPQFRSPPPPPDRPPAAPFDQHVDASPPSLTVAQIRDRFKKRTLPRQTAVRSLQRPKAIGGLRAPPSPGGRDLFETPPSEGADLFHAPLAKAEDLTQATPNKDVESSPTSNCTLDHSPLTPYKADGGLLQRSSSQGADLFKAPHSVDEDLFQPPPTKSTDLFQAPPTKVDGLFQSTATKGEDLFPAPPSKPKDLLQALLTKSKDLCQAPSPKGDGLFQSTATKGEDLFQAPPIEPIDLFQAPPTKPKDLFPAPPTKPKDLFQAPPTKGDGLFQSTTTKGEDLFQAPPSKPKDLFQAPPIKPKDLFQAPPTKGDGLFQSTATKGEDLFQAPPTKSTDQPKVRESEGEDPFESPNIKGEDLFYAPALYSKDPFGPSSTTEEDLFLSFPRKIEDPFRDSFPKGEDLSQAPGSFTKDPFPPFPTLTSDPFEEGGHFLSSDPFSPPSCARPDVFQPPSETRAVSKNRAFFPTTPDDPDEEEEEEAGRRAPSPRRISPGKESDVLSSSRSSSEKTHRPLKPPPPTPANKPHGIFLTTPRGTSHGIVPPTPAGLKDGTLQARPLPPTPAPNGLTQMRKTADGPPTPAPRTKPGKQLNQFRESKMEDVKDCVDVFENILLIGQERCVEDWPENSPELNPDFKPSGRLRLRRESQQMAADSEGGSGEDLDENGKHNKPKKSRKFKVSFITRRGSKDKFGDELKGADSGTLRRGSKERRRSKEGSLDEDPARKDADLFSGGEYHDEQQSGATEDSKPKKPLKQRVSLLLRRGSKDKFGEELKHANGHAAHLLTDHKQQEVAAASSGGEGLAAQRWTQDARPNGNSELEEEEGEEKEEEEEDGEEAEVAPDNAFKRRRRVKVKFVPQRGFSISLEKDEVKGAHGYTPRKQSKDDLFEDGKGAMGYSPHPPLQDGFPRSADPPSSAGETNGAMGDCKPKTSLKLKLPHVKRTRSKSLEGSGPPHAEGYSLRRRSQEGYLDDDHPHKGADLFSGSEYDEQYGTEVCKPKKPSKFKGPLANRRKSKANHQEVIPHECAPAALEQRAAWHRTPHEGFHDDGPHRAVGFLSPAEDSEDGDGADHCKAKKPFRFKNSRKHRKGAKSKGTIDPPGATSSDYYQSEAAEAEWCSAQMDERLAGGLEEEEEEEGDTDSLMEWWNTVEQWDEVPSDEEDKTLKEDETRSFISLAEKVHRGLRVFNKVFTERAEVLWQHVITLHAIADDISSFHRKAKIGNITGGTTAAVGGVAAIAGLALAPLTFGASLIVTAVGVGVATAGGIASASAAISDNVNNMHDRKKVEVVLEDYEARLEDVARVLRFVLHGLWKLRGHPMLMAGTQHYSGDWEVRRAVQMASLVDRPAARAGEVAEASMASVRGLFGGMDEYFAKDSRELKKGCKKEVVAQIKQLAHELHRNLVELNALREELQDANGGI